MTDDSHTFIPVEMTSHTGDYVLATCRCGWVSAYSHASERFAKEDYDFHVTVESKRS